MSPEQTPIGGAQERLYPLGKKAAKRAARSATDNRRVVEEGLGSYPNGTPRSDPEVDLGPWRQVAPGENVDPRDINYFQEAVPIAMVPERGYGRKPILGGQPPLTPGQELRISEPSGFTRGKESSKRAEHTSTISQLGETVKHWSRKLTGRGKSKGRGRYSGNRPSSS